MEKMCQKTDHMSRIWKKKSKFVLRQLERKRNGNVYVYIFFQVLQGINEKHGDDKPKDK